LMCLILSIVLVVEIFAKNVNFTFEKGTKPIAGRLYFHQCSVR